MNTKNFIEEGSYSTRMLLITKGAFPESSTAASGVSPKGLFAGNVHGDNVCVNSHTIQRISLWKQQAFQQSYIPYEMFSSFLCFPLIMNNLDASAISRGEDILGHKRLYGCQLCKCYASSRRSSSRHDLYRLNIFADVNRRNGSFSKDRCHRILSLGCAPSSLRD